MRLYVVPTGDIKLYSVVAAIAGDNVVFPVVARCGSANDGAEYIRRTVPPLYGYLFPGCPKGSPSASAPVRSEREAGTDKFGEDLYIFYPGGTAILEVHGVGVGVVIFTRHRR